MPRKHECLASLEYQEAYERSGKAMEAFRAASLAYRAGQIGDEQYLAAAATHKAAMAEYDAAFEKEERR